MKRIFKKSMTVVLSTVLIAPTMFMFNEQSHANSVTYYTPQEIQTIAEKSLNNGFPNVPKKDGYSTNADGFLVKEYTGYNPSYVTNNDEAFELARYAFDTRGATSANITVKYEQATTINWVVTGSASFSVETSAFWGLIEPKVAVSTSVSRSTSTSTAIGASMNYGVQLNKVGYVKMYAGGMASGGAMTYKWRDVTGRTGTGSEVINTKIPYSRYASQHIKFGRLVYTG